MSTGVAYSFSLGALALLCVLGVKALAFVLKQQNLNTEDTEISEGTETSSRCAPACLRDRNFSVPSGLRIAGIGRMKLDMVNHARMLTVFAANRGTEG